MRKRSTQGSSLNGRRATLNDVARRAKVSPVTVSRAIRHPEMVSEPLRLRIDDAVRVLNYIPNHLASALASTRTHIIGAIVPSITNGVFDDYLAAIQDVVGAVGIQMLVLNSRYSELEEEKAIETLLGYHPEAMIVVGVDQTERSRQLLKNSGIPVAQTMDVTDTPIDMVFGFDHRAAGAAAVTYLLDQGHKRVAHLTVQTDPRAGRRRQGYEDAMRAYGYSTEGLISAALHPSTVVHGGEMFSEVLARAPDLTAVFTCNDDLALGTLFECHRRGIRVPEQIAIVGFNDLEFCEASFPPLTSVATERREAGVSAAKAIVEIIRGSGKRPKSPAINMGFSIKERGSSLKPGVKASAKRPTKGNG